MKVADIAKKSTWVEKLNCVCASNASLTAVRTAKAQNQTNSARTICNRQL